MAPVETEARDRDSLDVLDAWHTPPAMVPGPERVLEHRIVDGESGWARLANAAVGVAVTITWDSAVLPRINQWLDPNPGMAVLGVEPSNCTTRGRAYDREHGLLPMLAPGATRRTGLTIEAAVFA